MSDKAIVVTGGAGYIGNYVVHNLLEHNFKVVIIDDFSNSSMSQVNPRALCMEGDFADKNVWRTIIAQRTPVAVIHLAAYIDVTESFEKPEQYLENNAQKTDALLSILHEHNITNLIFASTSGVYGNAADVPVTEQTPAHPENPYAVSKHAAEHMIERAHEKLGLNAIIFRFFNCCGSLPEVGIVPHIHSSLFSQIRKCVHKDIAELLVYGNQFPTKDGTCIRDFVHVNDIARCCIGALQYITTTPGVYEVINIGTGTGFSVQEVINQAKDVLGIDFPVRYVEPRKDEVVVSVASNEKLRRVLGISLNYSDLNNLIKTSLQ